MIPIMVMVRLQGTGIIGIIPRPIDIPIITGTRTITADRHIIIKRIGAPQVKGIFSAAYYSLCAELNGMHPVFIGLTRGSDLGPANSA